MNKNYCRMICALIVFVVLLTAAPVAEAQKQIVKRVELKADGAATFKGTLPRGEMTHVYLLRAAKNQRLKVSITFTGRGDAEFTLKRPDGEMIDEDSIILTDWEGVLPETGDYKISVFNPAQIRGIIKYALKIGIEK